MNNQTMDFLRVPTARTVVSSLQDKGVVAATRLARNGPNHGLVDQHKAEDAFMVSIQLRDYSGGLWVDDRTVDSRFGRRGTFTFYDLRRLWQADLQTAFDCVNFHIPRSAINLLEEDLGGQRIDTLGVDPGRDVEDRTVYGLTQALLPAFDAPEETSRLFCDHLAMSLTVHLATTYGQGERVPPAGSGGLSRAQLGRVLELIDADLSGDLTIAFLAKACGLSPGYFARGFRLSTGMPPHRWMLERRLDKAKDLIRSSRLTLAEISDLCGFASQSHMTRAFRKAHGLTPRAFRRGATDRS